MVLNFDEFKKEMFIQIFESLPVVELPGTRKSGVETHGQVKGVAFGQRQVWLVEVGSTSAYVCPAAGTGRLHVPVDACQEAWFQAGIVGRKRFFGGQTGDKLLAVPLVLHF